MTLRAHFLGFAAGCSDGAVCGAVRGVVGCHVFPRLTAGLGGMQRGVLGAGAVVRYLESTLESMPFVELLLLSMFFGVFSHEHLPGQQVVDSPMKSATTLVGKHGPLAPGPQPRRGVRLQVRQAARSSIRCGACGEEAGPWTPNWFRRGV